MRGGFQYTPPRPIQYGKSPMAGALEGLSRGISQGIGLGMQMRQDRPSDVIIADPGGAEDFDKTQFLGEEMADLQMLEKWEKDTAGDSKEQKDLNYKSLVNEGAVRSPIVIQALKSGVKPKEIRDAFNALEAGDPLANAKIGRLKQKMGGYWYNKKTKKMEGGGIYIVQKEQEIKNARAGQLEAALSSILKYHEDPRKYEGRTGRINEETKEVVRKEDQYIAELYQIDPNRAKAYLDKRKSQRGRSGKGFKPKSKLDWINSMERTYELNKYTDKGLAKQMRASINYLKSKSGEFLTNKDHQVLDSFRVKFPSKRSGGKAGRKAEEEAKEDFSRLW